MNEYTISRTSAQSADVQDIELGRTGTTRKILRAQFVRETERDEWKLKVWFIHQRKKKNDEWGDIKDIKLSDLKSGEGVAFPIPSEYVKALFNELENLKIIADQRGIRWGKRDLIVSEKGKVIELTQDTARRKKEIEQLIKAGHGDEFWKALSSIHPALAKSMVYAELHFERETALKTFEQHLKNEDWGESAWQTFFKGNQWIFGYGLRYQFIEIRHEQPNYGGETFEGRGKQKGDYLAATKGNERFTVIVEIKRPDTLIFDQANKQYRNAVPIYSSEFIHAVSQAQVNARTWDVEGSQRRYDREKLDDEHINTIIPRAILIIGNSKQLTTQQQTDSFGMFRRHLSNPDVITFDELYERAKYIVQQTPDEQLKESKPAFDRDPWDF
jgi:hypothetical protein